MTQLPASPDIALSGLLPALMDGFMLAVVHRSGHLVMVNVHLARALGHDPKALEGQELTTIVPESGQGFNPSDVLGFLAHCRCWLGKLSLRKADGQTLLVQATMVPLKGDAGQIDKVLILATSAARQQDFPLLVADVQDGFYSMLEGLATPVLLHRQGSILYANQAMLSLTGYSLAALQALPYEELTHPESRECLRQRLAARLRGETTQTRFESCLQSATGQRCWVEQAVGMLPVDGQAALLDTYVSLNERRKNEAQQMHMRQVLAQIIDGSPVPTMVIDEHHVVTHWNRAIEKVSSVSAKDMVGTRDQWKPFYDAPRPVLADLIVDSAQAVQVREHYQDRYRPSDVIPDAWEAEGFFPNAGRTGLWFAFTASPLRNSEGRIMGAIETLVDVTRLKTSEIALQAAHDDLEQQVQERTGQLAAANAQLAQDNAERRKAEVQLRQHNEVLEKLNQQLTQAQAQLAQSEKLASIGQLAAGVAHEINNPIGYVHSNIGSLRNYLDDLLALLTAYEKLPSTADIDTLRKKVDVEFLREDIPSLISESQEGITRVKKIVQDLKDFSRVDSSQEWQTADLHHGIDSTLNIVNNEIKYKADVVKEYGVLPPVECLPSQLNQVFMNLLVNAAHAMGEERGCITIRSGTAGDWAWLEFADNGGGMPQEIQQKIFDPFFTTKAVGKGTGLGLSLTYGIIQKHHGRITVQSQVGKGTVFRIELPIAQPAPTTETETEHV